MPHEVRIDAARRIVVATLQGAANRGEIVEMVTGARAAAAASGFNILYDMRGSVPAVSSGELFWMPRQIDALRSPDAGKVRVAGLSLPEHLDGARIWETMFRNAGLQAQAFTEEAAAVAWLTE